VFAIGAGVGFTLALVLMAGLRERLNLAIVPNVVQGAALSLMLAGLLSLAFMGFAGLGGLSWSSPENMFRSDMPRCAPMIGVEAVSA
jgi:hypothetical protein